MEIRWGAVLITILNSNFLITLTTFLVGTFAIGLYIKQRREYKRDTALLIRQEIRYAEQQIGSACSLSSEVNTYLLSVKLLPTNIWYKNMHLFINDFEQAQIDIISRFYSQVEYMDLVIEKISDYKVSMITETILDPQGRKIGEENILPERVYLNRIARILPALHAKFPSENVVPRETPSSTAGEISQQMRDPVRQVISVDRLNASEILQQVSDKVDFLYNTPIGERLKELSEKKWFGFF